MKIKEVFPELLYANSKLHITFQEGESKALAKLFSSIGLIDKDKDYEIIIRPVKKKRSMDANSYLWILSDKLADVLHITKIEVYQKAIREVGVFETVLLIDKAVDRFIADWNSKGIGYLAEVSHKSKIEGCTAVRAYYGSSSYDTKEMSRLIDYLVDECKSQGIETMTPNEIEELKQKWG